MRSFRSGLIVLLSLAAAALRAQSTVPALTQAFSPQTLSPEEGSATIDLRNHFGVPGVVGTKFAQFDTVMGRFAVELRDDVAPQHVANFLAYAAAGEYANTFIHRSADLDGSGFVSIVQGGGYAYRLPFEVYPITRRAAVPLEYNLPNARGTLAAARTTDINSATSEWYFNVRDNSTILNQGNGGGYTVFGQVLGAGMTVVDAIAALQRVAAQSPFQQLPIRNYTGGNITEANLVIVNAVRPATLFPEGSGTSVVTFSVSNSAASVVNASISGSTLTVAPLSSGTATLTIRAMDTHGAAAEGSLTVTVTNVAPSIVAQPLGATVAEGSTAALSVSALGSPAPTYQWLRNGTSIAGATSATLLLPNANAATAGEYRVVVTNAVGSVTSAPAQINVANGQSRLTNLSVRANVGTQPLIVGFATSGGKSVLLRGIGPTLASYGVGNAYQNPRLDLYNSSSDLIGGNDNWDSALAPVFDSVGAFPLVANSDDAALQVTLNGGYTAHLGGTGPGVALVEVYDAGAGTDIRLVNVSARTLAGTGDNALIAGFYVDGSVGKTLLIRAVGPGLATYGVTGWLADPKLEIFTGDPATKIAENNDWSSVVGGTFDSVGAFGLPANSRDAALLVTLMPGLYSAQVSGVDGGTGEALVEVYEVR